MSLSSLTFHHHFIRMKEWLLILWILVCFLISFRNRERTTFQCVQRFSLRSWPWVRVWPKCWSWTILHSVRPRADRQSFCFMQCLWWTSRLVEACDCACEVILWYRFVESVWNGLFVREALEVPRERMRTGPLVDEHTLASGLRHTEVTQLSAFRSPQPWHFLRNPCWDFYMLKHALPLVSILYYLRP